MLRNMKSNPEKIGGNDPQSKKKAALLIVAFLLATAGSGGLGFVLGKKEDERDGDDKVIGKARNDIMDTLHNLENSLQALKYSDDFSDKIAELLKDAVAELEEIIDNTDTTNDQYAFLEEEVATYKTLLEGSSEEARNILELIGQYGKGDITKDELTESVVAVLSKDGQDQDFSVADITDWLDAADELEIAPPVAENKIVVETPAVKTEAKKVAPEKIEVVADPVVAVDPGKLEYDRAVSAIINKLNDFDPADAGAGADAGLAAKDVIEEIDKLVANANDSLQAKGSDLMISSRNYANPLSRMLAKTGQYLLEQFDSEVEAMAKSEAAAGNNVSDAINKLTSIYNSYSSLKLDIKGNIWGSNYDSLEELRDYWWNNQTGKGVISTHFTGLD